MKKPSWIPTLRRACSSEGAPSSAAGETSQLIILSEVELDLVSGGGARLILNQVDSLK
jgi:hypothetical protein